MLDLILYLEKPTGPYLSAAHGYVFCLCDPLRSEVYSAPMAGYLPEIFLWDTVIFLPTNA